MSIKLTPKQRNVLEFIYTFLENSGFPPSISELKEELNVSSNQSVLNFLDTLEKKGYIKREKDQARGLKILPMGAREIGKDVLIKVVGTSAAGPYIESYANAFSFYPVQKGILEKENIADSQEKVFVIQVQGDSMTNIGIENDDMLLVKEAKEFKSGDIVVAETDEGATVKRFIAEGGKRYLKPENPNYENILIIPGEVRFRGRVILNLSKIK
ncbi:MAG: transcriptional repressor LexA [Parcubacteria group bacterium]|jgi:repressor LexA